MPSYIWPVSGDTLIGLIVYTGLESRLDSAGREKLERLIGELSGDTAAFRPSEDFSFNVEAQISTLAYTQSANEADVFGSPYTYVPGYEPAFRPNEIPPFVRLEADLLLADHAAGHFEYEYSSNFEDYLSDRMQTNLPFGRDRNTTVPYNVYLSGGTRHYSVYAGRVRSSSGSGITGNLGIGDNFLYRNALKLQINALPFTYELLVNRFDAEEWDGAVNTRYPDTQSSNLTHISRLDSKAPIVVVHKANLLVFKKINVGLYEAIMDYSRCTIADPKLLGPFNLLHNNLSYQYDTNNFFGAEVDWAPMPSLALHSEVMFDQIQLSDEKDKMVPSAWGGLLNARYSLKSGKSRFVFYAEGVYTSPWLYLKPSGDYSSTDANYFTLDLIAGNYHMHDAKFDTGYLGYKWGPNCVVANIGAVWSFKRNTMKADILYKANGNTGLWFTDKTATGKDEYVDAKSPYIFGSGEVQTLVQISLKDRFDWFGNGNLLFFGGVVYQHYTNLGCEKGKDLGNVIVSVGAVLKPIRTFWRGSV